MQHNMTVPKSIIIILFKEYWNPGQLIWSTLTYAAHPFSLKLVPGFLDHLIFNQSTLNCTVMKLFTSANLTKVIANKNNSTQLITVFMQHTMLHIAFHS